MAYNTAIFQGNFVSGGVAETLNLRGSLDWIEVFNQTTAAAGAAVGTGYQFFWQRGMAQGQGFAYSNPAVPVMAQLAADTGFYLLDSSVVSNSVGAAVITNISNATPPRVTSAGHGLVTGDIVRLVSCTGAQQLGAIDYRVTRVDANNFDLSWMAPIVAAAAPGASANFYKISNEAIYQPKQRVITSVSQAAQAVVVFAAPHNFTVGQEVRFKVPTVTAGVAYGMVELNNVQATVTAISVANNSITVDVDTTGFTAFAFPLTANVPFSPAQVVPVGEDTGAANDAGVSVLGDAVNNSAIIGVKLQPGVLSPAGALNDQIFWRAGVSFSVDNAF